MHCLPACLWRRAPLRAATRHASLHRLLTDLFGRRAGKTLSATSMQQGIALLATLRTHGSGYAVTLLLAWSSAALLPLWSVVLSDTQSKHRLPVCLKRIIPNYNGLTQSGEHAAAKLRITGPRMGAGFWGRSLQRACQRYHFTAQARAVVSGLRQIDTCRGIRNSLVGLRC